MAQEWGVELEVGMQERAHQVLGAQEDSETGGDELLGRISLEAEVPEVLFDGMREFIRNHPQWDQYRLITSALASFLFQNGSQEACVTQHYLNGLFMR
jgi:hypothetical protein